MSAALLHWSLHRQNGSRVELEGRPRLVPISEEQPRAPPVGHGLPRRQADLPFPGRCVEGSLVIKRLWR
jgi:hypothetical protein